jgi:eukaryotic-like serine/threonine-protein kinase
VKTLGPYRLLRRLAVGGMGEVYLARRLAPGPGEELVVVKTLLPGLKREPEFVAMFYDEARIASALHHPNIARIDDVGEDHGEHYIAMEYVRGCSLRDLLERAAAQGLGLPPALTCRVVAEAAAALDFAHQAKTAAGEPLDLIHRDVSPQNVLLGFDGAVKLIDFGVAKATNKLVRTAVGTIKGKYAYMSPEQAYGEPLDGRSDVFGLGILFWEALTGERLFKRNTETETLKAVVGAPLQPPSARAPAVPRALDVVVMRALMRDRDDRYSTAGELKRAIEAFLVRQRWPAGPEELAAFLAKVFPGGAEAGASTGDEPTPATDTSTPSLEPPPGSSGPDPAELEVRLAAVPPGAAVKDLVLEALVAAVARQLGPAGEALLGELAPTADGASSTRPTGDLLRLAWRAAALLSPAAGGADAAFERLGAGLGEALLASPAGTSLAALAAPGPPRTLKALLQAVGSLLGPAARTLVASGPTSATLVLEDAVLPAPLVVGLLRVLVAGRLELEVSARWTLSRPDSAVAELAWGAPGR